MTEKRIDCDVHVAARPDALEGYLSDYWRDLLDSVGFRTPPGVATTYPPWSEALATSPNETTLERVQEDVLGSASQAILNCYFGVESVQHPYFAADLATAVNRWLADEWLDKEDRLLASAVVTPQFPQAAVAEIERIADDPRFVQILLPARAMSSYGNQIFWPIWEAAAAHGLALGITYGGGAITPPTPVNWMGTFFEEYAVSIVGFESHVSSMIFGGIFHRWPQLKVVLMESGWTWLPSFLWRMDKEWKSGQREVPWISASPSQIVRSNFRVTTAPTDAPDRPGQLRQVLDQSGGAELLLYASDFPHVYPTGVEPLLAELSDEEAERVLWRNAWDTYALGERVPAVG